MTCFFLSAISLKRLNAVFSACALDAEAQLLQRLAQRVAAGVLAEHERVGRQADGGGVHDLVGRALLQHAVLVDARLVRERVAPDDRLVRLHRVAGQARDQAARARDLGRVRLACPGRCRRARVCSSITISSSDALPARSPMPLIAHSTWRAPACTPANELATASPRSSWQCTDSTTSRSRRHQLVQLAQEGRVLVRHRVADGVGDVDRRGALVDRDLHHLGGELDVGAGGVHRRELDVVADIAWRARRRRAPAP